MTKTNTEEVTVMQVKYYRAQCARDAQAMGYGDESYWDYLEQRAREHREKGIADALTRSLAESLRGNERD